MWNREPPLLPPPPVICRRFWRDCSWPTFKFWGPGGRAQGTLWGCRPSGVPLTRPGSEAQTTGGLTPPFWPASCPYVTPCSGRDSEGSRSLGWRWRVWGQTQHQTFPCPLRSRDEKGGAVNKEHTPPMCSINPALGGSCGIGRLQAEVASRAAFWVRQQLAWPPTGGP